MSRISIEREFALVNGKPISGQRTIAFMRKLEQAKERIDGLSAVDREVAHNAIEMKFSLLSRDSGPTAIGIAREVVDELARAEGLKVIWTNQQRHSYDSHNEFFTTLVFPELVDALVHTNSTQVHFEVPPADAIKLYRGLNAAAPWFLLNSAEGEGFSRLAAFRQFNAVLGRMFIPVDYTSLEDHAADVRDASSRVHHRLLGIGRYESARRAFPNMFKDGMVFLSNDKIFHPARLRPDLQLPNGNISIEFRALDGIKDAKKEMRMLNMLLWTAEAIMEAGEINDMASVASFYDDLSPQHKAYKLAERFVQHAVAGRLEA